jgi:hypothetical protein
MREGGRWSGAPGDVDDPEFVEAVMDTYPREVPVGGAHDAASR